MNNHNFGEMEYQETVDLIIKFLVTFSSFEYTLKNLGYVQGGMQDTRTIRLDWQSYIKEIKPELPSKITDIPIGDVEEAIHYLHYWPPQKEIILNGQLDYQPISNAINFKNLNWDMVAVFVWRIRNNLFHGEKSPFTEPNGRDRALIFHAITLLPRLNDMGIR